MFTTVYFLFFNSPSDLRPSPSLLGSEITPSVQGSSVQPSLSASDIVVVSLGASSIAPSLIGSEADIQLGASVN